MLRKITYISLFLTLFQLVFFANELDKKASVLFINIDDLNDWNSVLQGHPQAKTPNLKRLSELGVTFTNAICPSPVCFSSRTAIFSGLHPSRSGAISNDHAMHSWRSYVSDVLTIPKYLDQHGWHTVGVAKNFHGGDGVEFEHYVKREKELRPIKKIVMAEYLSHRYWGVANGEAEKMSDYKAVTDGIQFIQSVKQPLFLSIGIYKPHLPWVVPQKYYDLYPLNELQLPKIQEQDLNDLADRFKSLAHNEVVFGPDIHKKLLQNGKAKQMVQAYLACLSFADEQLGRLLDAWQASTHAEHGYIILWSDHGYMLGEKEAWSKMKPWYDSSRVNLMISGPEISKNAICDKAVSLQDLYPTLVDLLQLPEPKHKLDGKSIKPLLRDPAMNWNRPVVMSHETGGIRYDVVLENRFRMTKLITGETELYDLFEDPHEWHNLSNKEEYSKVITELEQHLTFSYPEVHESAWFEAENFPTQTSGDYLQRKNCHFRKDHSSASAGRIVCVDLLAGKNNYLDFVVKIRHAGKYDVGVELSSEATGQIYLSPVNDDQKQADSNYPMIKVSSFSKGSKDQFSLFKKKHKIVNPGLYIFRVSSDVPKQSIKIDRLYLKLLNKKIDN